MVKLRELRDRYTFNTREFGKVLTVASITLLAFSMHTALEFQSASSQLDNVNDNFTQASGIINSQGFNESLEALQSVRGTDIAPQFIQAAEAFRSAQQSLETSERAQDNIQNSFELYQWLVLISILGIVAGVSIIYILDPRN